MSPSPLPASPSPASSGASQSVWHAQRWVLLLAALAAIGHIAAGLASVPLLAVILKPLPVWGLALWVIRSARDRFAKLVFIGLLLGSVGDILLGADGERLFIHGLLAFLFGHLFFLAAFLSDERRLRLLAALPILAGAVAVFRICQPSLGPLAIPVLVYIGILSTVAWRAVARISAGATVRPDQWAGAAGAVIFAMSDSVIALDRFHAPIPHAHLAIMALYWLGQLGIARSALRPRPGA